ncbi:MAG: FHA domain-containing protein [Actinobacteria bacterium]|nr:FHA domain-containing protein [Actinomycetota bacterium]
MNAAESQSELTSTIHLGVRGVAQNSPAKTLEDLLSSLDEKSQVIVREIAQSSGEKAMLVIARGPQKGSRFLITSEGVSIGRSTESAIFLDDVTVSRSHAQIKREEGGPFVLIDNSSLNGTYLNNISVQKNVLKSGDEIQIGKFHFVFIGSTK